MNYQKSVPEKNITYTTLAFSPSGPFLLIADGTKMISLCEKPRHTFLTPHFSWSPSLNCLPNRPFFVCWHDVFLLSIYHVTPSSFWPLPCFLCYRNSWYFGQMLSRSSDPFSHLRSPFTVYTRATIPVPCRSSNNVTSPTHIFRSTSLTALTHFEQTNLWTRLIAYGALAEFKRFLNLIRYAWLNFIFSGLVLLYVMQYHSQQERKWI